MFNHTTRIGQICVGRSEPPKLQRETDTRARRTDKLRPWDLFASKALQIQ